MNLSKHREKNIVHIRGLFLASCAWAVIGDILGISLWEIYLFIFLLYLFSIAYISKIYRMLAIFGAISMIGGYILGYSVIQERMEKLHRFTSEYHLWEKYAWSWEIDALLFQKDMSRVYRLRIDNFDNTSTWFSIPDKDYSIAVEVPKNLSIQIWDSISFTGKIEQSISIPLRGFDKYLFFHETYASLSAPTFLRYASTEPKGIIENLKEYWNTVFLSIFPKDVASIILGMTIGDDTHLSSETKNDFISSGISHILVVSGSNIAFLILFLSFFLKYLPITKYIRMASIWCILFFYGSLVWWDVSVIRAIIMGILSYIIAEYGGNVASLSTLAFSAIILTIIEPLAPLYDAGFGLSFGATAGILLFQERGKILLQKYHIHENFHAYITLSVGAMFGSLPVMIYHFWSLSSGSLIINLFIGWCLGFILWYATIYFPLAIIFEKSQYLLWYILYIPTQYIITLSDVFGKMPALSIPEEFRGAIASILFGIYTVLFFEKIFTTLHSHTK